MDFGKSLTDLHLPWQLLLHPLPRLDVLDVLDEHWHLHLWNIYVQEVEAVLDSWDEHSWGSAKRFDSEFESESPTTPPHDSSSWCYPIQEAAMVQAVHIPMATPLVAGSGMG